MPWCPECKTEYEEGVLKCSDCDINLVDDLDNDQLYWVTLVEGEEQESLEGLQEFLIYSKIEKVQIIEEDEREKFLLQVHQNDLEEAKKFVGVYLYNKKLEEKENEEVEDEEESVEASPQKTAAYEDKEKKVSDIKSSAFSFITVGLLGVAFIIFTMIGVIPIDLAPNYEYFFYGLISVVSGLFIIFGCVSFTKLKHLQAEANAFTAQVNEVKEWFKDQYGIKEIDEDIQEGMNEEAKYFVRYEFIKEKIQIQYPELETAIVEGVGDELYDEIYG